MTREQADDSGNEELADAIAQIESLQSAAADAEARAETVRGELSEAVAAREFAEAELTQLRADVEGARALARDAALRYREARLAAQPDIPDDLVPEAETVEEVDRAFDSAVKVVGRVRERVQEEGRKGARVPAGSPARSAPDLSGLPASEKIRLGLQQLSERS
jgi:hypothetical protein